MKKAAVTLAFAAGMVVGTHAAANAAAGLLVAEAEKPWFMNVVPAWPGTNLEFSVSEMIRQKDAAGLDLFVPSLSFHPQTTPAENLIPELCGRFHRMKRGVEGKGIRLGVLVQSILGHGWNGKVPLTDEKWQHVVLFDGRESPRFCSLDPGFRDYTRKVIKAVAQEKPEFILIDDDVGIRHDECFCPLHLARMGRALGRPMTYEAARKLYAEKPVSDPEVVKANRVLRDSIVEYAREAIRAPIDEVDPSMRCGLCMCGYWFANDVVHALAGGTKPFARVGDAVYSNYHALFIVHAFRLQRAEAYQLDDDVDVLDEADTFPHNYMSESATMYHAHLTTALLSGLAGAKLWTSEFQEPAFANSQRRYEARLKNYAGFYAALRGMAKAGIRWQGVGNPLVRPPEGFDGNPVWGGFGIGHGERWNCPIEAVYAIPLRYEGVERGGVMAVREEDVDRMSDAQITQVLSGRALVDSLAARKLTERGFAGLLGVKAEKGGGDFHFNSEWSADGSHSIGHMWKETDSELTPVDPKARATWNYCQGDRFQSPKPRAPAAVRYENKLGGRVVTLGWWLDLVYFDMFRPVRKLQLVAELDWLNGAPLDYVGTSGDQMLVRHGKLPGGEDLVACISICYEVLPRLELRRTALPARAEKLNANGSWEPVDFVREGKETISFGVRVDPLEPIILKITK